MPLTEGCPGVPLQCFVFQVRRGWTYGSDGSTTSAKTFTHSKRTRLKKEPVPDSPLYYSRFKIHYSPSGCLLTADERFLARTKILRMARHLRHAAHVDAGGRQDPPEANAAGESLVERTALCFGAWSHDLGHALPGSHLRNRIRFHRSQAADRMQRRRGKNAGAASAVSG